MISVIQKIVFVLYIVAIAAVSYSAGKQNVELKWTQERERLLTEQIKTLKAKDHEIAKLQTTISTINDSAVRVRSKDTELQRKLQTELRECGRFRTALERCSSTLTRCAEHATRDRKIIEFCAIELK